MAECKVCGEACKYIGNGTYKCSGCGKTYSQEDFIDFEDRLKIEAARTKAAEEARAKAEIEQAKIKAQIEREKIAAEEVRAKAEIEQAKIKAQIEREKIAAERDARLKSGGDGAEIFEKCINGVCEIRPDNSSASGYLIHPAGYVVTNYHVIANNDGSLCKTVTVKVAGESVYANVIASAAQNKSQFCSNADLALLKLARLPFGAKPLKFGSCDKLRTGETVFVIGNSLGQGNCITKGIISDKNRNGQLMYDCSTNPGNSGSPVFNSDGLIIGTHVAGTSPNGVKAQGMNIAIPCSYAIALLSRHGINI